MNRTNTRIPALCIDEAINQLTKMYSSVIRGGKSVETVPSVFLWGPPGVGKSEAVDQIAEGLEALTGKKVIVKEIRVPLYNPIDFHGVPTADVSKTHTVWLKPQELELDPSEDTINILFLDELTAAPQSVQVIAYQMTLDHSVGEHKLPKNTIVIAAGNRTTDKSVAYHMPKALANRLLHIEIRADFDTWKDWAIKTGVHSYVMGYLMFDNSKLLTEEVGMDDLAYPSPRSWVFVSDILNSINTDEIDDIYSLIAGCIGTGTAIEFVQYCKIYKDLPSIEDIIMGRKVTYPNSPDVLYAIISSLISYVSKNVEKLGFDDIENICDFCNDLQPDYATCMYRTLSAINTVQSKLSKSSSFRTWIKINNRMSL